MSGNICLKKLFQDKNRTISAVDGFVGVAISVQQEKKIRCLQKVQKSLKINNSTRRN